MSWDNVGAYLEDNAGLEVDGEPDILGAEFIDEDGDSVVEVGANVRRRGFGGLFNFRKLRIPSGIVRSKMSLAPAAPINPRRTYGEPNEHGALTPFAVGRATAAAPTVIVESQNSFMPVRMWLTCFDTAAPAPVSLLFTITVTEIKVGARSMLRAGGAATGVPAVLWSDNVTGANSSRFDTIRPGTQFTITIAGLAGTVVCDVGMTGRVG